MKMLNTEQQKQQAQRALQEAQARKISAPELPPEIGGRGGKEPVRYGDWELNGRAIDF